MRLLFMFSIIILCCFCTNAMAVLDSLEIPFGVQGLGLGYSPAELDSLGNIGLNYVAEMSNEIRKDTIIELYNHGIQLAKGGLGYAGSPGGAVSEAPFMYSMANYVVLYADSAASDREVRLLSFGDSSSFSNGLWISRLGSQGDTLTGISTYGGPRYENDPYKNKVTFDRKYYFNIYNPDSSIRYTADSTIHYYLRLRSKINNPDSLNSNSVAIVKINAGARLDGGWFDRPCSLYTLKTDTLRVLSFKGDSLQNLELGCFTIPDTIKVKDLCNDNGFTNIPNQGKGTVWLNIEIVTSGISEFAVENITLYDSLGVGLVENGTYDSLISAKFTDYSGYSDKIFAWELYDEPMYSNFRPIKRIKDLMKGVNSDWNIYTYNWKYDPRDTQIRSWLRIVGEDHAFPDIYTITDGEANYYGSYYQSNEGWPGGCLAILNRNISWVREEINDEGKDFWIALQAHSDIHSNPYFRKPTTSELACETYMALAWGAKGLNYYMYKYAVNDSLEGIVTIDDVTTPAYYELKNHISPYIHAIGSHYMPLTWDSCYVISPGIANQYGCYVNSISALPDDNNPDAGWFQAGQYTKAGTSEKYVMIVNRACNKDARTIAPPVTATVRFNPGAVGSNYVLITDLADSLRHAGGDTGWVGIPRTTYSTTMPDGYIPYTITLKAGEGKLIKIVSTNEIKIMGAVSTSNDYQGRIKILSDCRIPTYKAMRINGPAIIEFADHDSLYGGVDTSLVEFVIDGVLSANGNFLDSVYFLPESGTAPGSWYGIRDRSSSYDTLAYCAIKYACNGFRADTNSHVLIKHCEISHSESSAVYLYNTGSSETKIDTSYLTANGNSGIYSYSSYFSARSNSITNNGVYGIYFKKRNGVAIPQLIIADNTIMRGDSGADTGVKIEGSQLDSPRPTASISGNYIESFDHEGILLSYCGTGPNGMVISKGNYVGSNGYYGLYCYNSSPYIGSSSLHCEEYNTFEYNSQYGIFFRGSCTSKIIKTNIRNNAIANVYCDSSAAPNFGDNTFAGKNRFATLDASDYDIKNYNTKAISAFGNWWGENPIDSTDFYPNITKVELGKPMTVDSCQGYRRVAQGESDSEIPTEFALHQNYPNPFNPTTTIFFDLPQGSWVRLTVYNILGQRIKTITDTQYPAGDHQVIWDGRNESGDEVTSGVYFYLLEANEFTDSKKMLLLR